MTESRDSLLAESRRLMSAGRWNEACARLEHALAGTPTDVLLAFSLASAYRFSGEIAKAETLLRRLNAAVPEMAEAATGLALCRAEKGAVEDAVTVLRRFLVRDPGVAAVWSTLADLGLKAERFDAATVGFTRAAMLAPTARNIGNLAEALSFQGLFEEAEMHHRAALAKLPDHPSLRLNYAVHLLSQGKVDNGWRYFEARLDPRRPDAPERKIPLPRWNGSNPASRHILLLSEQGLGDEIRLAAQIPELARITGKLSVECDPRLTGLFARSFDNVRVYPFSRIKRSGRGLYSYGWLPESGGPDCYIELGSLPHLLRRPLAAPENAGGFLKADSDRAARILSRLGTEDRRPLVGLSWASQAQTFGRSSNYPPLALWKPLLALPDTRFVSLLDDPSGDLTAAFAEIAETEILHLGDLDLRNDLEALAALESLLGLVISVGNATGALAGALGVPVIELVSTPGWVPLAGERDTFLGATRRLAQRRPGDWAHPLARAMELAPQLLRA